MNKTAGIGQMLMAEYLLSRLSDGKSPLTPVAHVSVTPVFRLEGCANYLAANDKRGGLAANTPRYQAVEVAEVGPEEL